MQPFERLRSIARQGGDYRALVEEAADCLGDFDDDPAALVVTCRQLLHHHPDSGPLWWLCSRVLAAPEPSEAAWEAEAMVRDDRTPGRLAALLPFPHDDPIAVLGWPELIGLGLESRPDLDVLAVRSNTAMTAGVTDWLGSDAIRAPGRCRRSRCRRAVACAGRGDRRQPHRDARARQHLALARSARPSRTARRGSSPGWDACCRPDSSRP